MTAIPLLQVVRFLARVGAPARPRAPSLLRRLFGPRRPPAMPPLSDRLYRDIGLEPPPREREEFWLLFGRP